MNKIILDERGAVFVDENGKEVKVIPWSNLRDYDYLSQFDEWVDAD
jgi:hypothetical protein